MDSWRDQWTFEEKVAVDHNRPKFGSDFDWTCPYCGTRQGASECWDSTSDGVTTEWCENCERETEFRVEYLPYYSPIMPRKEADE